MLYQAIEYGLIHDFFVIIRFSAVVLLFYLGIQFVRRIKEAGLISATTGFSIYMFGFGIMHTTWSFAFLYPWEYLSGDVLFYVNIFSIGTMAAYVILTELDSVRHASTTESGKFKYPLTLFSLIGTPILLFISLFDRNYMTVATIYIIIPIVICTDRFIGKFENLEIVKQTKPVPWFFAGLSLAGFSNFLYTIFSSPEFLFFNVVVNTLCIISGALMMSHAWNRLPNMSEFDWLSKMERLLVVYVKGSGLIFKYEFQAPKVDESGHRIDSDLAGTAIGGVDMLLTEILASKGHIKEIDHGDKKIVFSHGIYTACMLFTTGQSEEYRYRLDMFHLSFEKRFKEDLEEFEGNVIPYRKADELVVSHFLK